MDIVDTMGLCKVCAEKQDWLLESGDGSQVVCLCSNSQVGTRNFDASTQTPMKRAATTIPSKSESSQDHRSLL